MTTPSNLIPHLPFDSSLFGFPVGKYLAEEQWDEVEFLKNAKDYRLVYVFSKKPLHWISESIHFVDTKLTFQKELFENVKADPDILSYSGDLTETLLELAYQSGIYSRFKTDPGFVNGEYEKLYRIWIEKAVDQKEVLITKENEGFVGCHLAGEKAQIGLIAVGENHRGKGWGKKLVVASEHVAYERGARSLQIPTQQANTPACKLYQNLGYQVVDTDYVYHYWNPLWQT